MVQLVMPMLEQREFHIEAIGFENYALIDWPKRFAQRFGSKRCHSNGYGGLESVLEPNSSVLLVASILGLPRDAVDQEQSTKELLQLSKRDPLVWSGMELLMPRKKKLSDPI